MSIDRVLTRSVDVDLSGGAGDTRAARIAEALTPAALPDLASDAFAGMDRSALVFGAASSTTGQSDPLAHLTSGSVGTPSIASLVSQPLPLQALAAGDTPLARRALRARGSDADAQPRRGAQTVVRAEQRIPASKGEWCIDRFLITQI